MTRNITIFLLAMRAICERALGIDAHIWANNDHDYALSEDDLSSEYVCDLGSVREFLPHEELCLKDSETESYQRYVYRWLCNRMKQHKII